MNTSFYVSLDKDALYHNIEYLREYKQKELLPVIKANAYGHNSLLIAKALYDFNLKTWAVARFSEATSITEYMINNFSISDFKILVFESLDDDYSFLEKYPQICPTINSIKDLKNALANNIPIDRLVKLAEIYNSSPIEILGWEHYSNIPNSTKASIYNYLPYGVSAGLPEGPDYDVDFEKIERKLKSGDYRSSKKSYNVIKEFYLILYLFIFFLLQFYHLLYQSLLHFL